MWELLYFSDFSNYFKVHMIQLLCFCKGPCLCIMNAVSLNEMACLYWIIIAATISVGSSITSSKEWRLTWKNVETGVVSICVEKSLGFKQRKGLCMIMWLCFSQSPPCGPLGDDAYHDLINLFRVVCCDQTLLISYSSNIKWNWC